ncbi:YesL family protein [Sediminibacillus albus]|uniref:Uncharacterized membrane protein YesL n=1 Tax=Sediminibacillus albus TaxID=407036 RepID=A0A1G8ZWC8_9BACI|nr:YesL family protein [Sediminibacillus albus]SDK19301.1 Uncharacterized membrane protein YesL [Sediminibacillus albus]
MNGRGVISTLDVILHWITRLVVVNLLWICYSLAGLLIFGIFPATAAVFGITRKWLMGDYEVSIWKTFKKIYWQDFIPANIIGWIISILGGVLYLNFRIISGAEGELSIVVPFAFYVLLFFYAITLIWCFPLLAHYKGTCLQHLKNAFIIGFVKIHYTLTSGLILCAIIYFSLEFPGIIPFFTVSLTAVCWMWFALQIFAKVDHRMS